MSPSNEVAPESDQFNELVANKNNIRQKRLAEFESNISAQLQICLTNAAAAKSSANSAKTATKKKFYEKKFNKITAEAKQAIVALQQIKALSETSDVATPTGE